MSAPYVVGVNPNSPTNPHSAMASGGTDIGAIDTSPAQEAYVLYGAVIGGPDKRDKFYDLRSDWPETEVSARVTSPRLSIQLRLSLFFSRFQIALDYNAPMLTLAAQNVAQNPSDPFYTSLKAGAYDAKKPKGKPCDAANSCHGGLSKTAQIVIGVIVTVVGLGIIAAVGYIMWARKRGKA